MWTPVVKGIPSYENAGGSHDMMMRHHDGNAALLLGQQPPSKAQDNAANGEGSDIHTSQAAPALVMMLTAVTFNGYLSCCISFGIFPGSLVCDGDTVHCQKAEAVFHAWCATTY